jgi:hypothetical protein
MSGRFKDLYYFSPSESAESSFLLYLNHIEVKIEAKSSKMTMKYFHQT